METLATFTAREVKRAAEERERDEYYSSLEEQ